MNITESDREENIYYSAPLESYTPLETSVSLETTTPLENSVVMTSNNNIANSTSVSSTSQQPSSPQLPVLDHNAKLAMFDVHDAQASDRLSQDKPNFEENISDSSDFALIETIPLLEERLVINRSQHKIGEVIIRKEIETHIIEVPVRREKLIIEQVNPIHKQIAEVDLEPEEASGRELLDSLASDQNNQPVFNAEFQSVQLASQFLGAIAKLPRSGCQKVELRLELANPQLRATYQQWLEQFVAQVGSPKS